MATVSEPSGTDAGTRRANRRLAVALGLIAVGFYVMMLVVLPS